MSAARCAVYGCTSNCYSNKNRKHERKFIMHSFPKSTDLVSETIRKEWVRRCSRKDNFNPDSSRICCEHFTETDYERDLQHELLGLPLRKKLKKTAVPTIGIVQSNPKTSVSLTNGNEKMDKKMQKEVVVDLITKATSKENLQQKVMENVIVSNVEKSVTETDVENVTIIIVEDSESCMEQLFNPTLKNSDNNTSLISPSTSGTSYPVEYVEDHEVKYAKLLEEHNNLKAEYKRMQQGFKRKIEKLTSQVRYFKAKQLKNPKPNKTRKCSKCLKKYID